MLWISWRFPVFVLNINDRGCLATCKNESLNAYLQVTLTGGSEHPAKIVGFDEDRDVAVLQLITKEGDPVSALLLPCKFAFYNNYPSAMPDRMLGPSLPQAV